jgi:hypothetical protein
VTGMRLIQRTKHQRSPRLQDSGIQTGRGTNGSDGAERDVREEAGHEAKSVYSRSDPSKRLCGTVAGKNANWKPQDHLKLSTETTGAKP